MNKLLLLGTVAFCAIGADLAQATPISGTLNIVGSATFTSSEVTFTNPAAVLSGTGSFAELILPCYTCTTMDTPLGYSPTPPPPAAGTVVYSVSDGPDTSTFILGGVAVGGTPTFTPNPGGLPTLSMSFTGTATLTNYDPTIGVWTFTANENTGATSGSFSSTGVAAGGGINGGPIPMPEPASIALMGIALLGLGLAQRRSQPKD